MARNAIRISFLCAAVLAFTSLAQAQEMEVQGRVTEAESGFPLPGVNIAVQGTQIGTTTDLDGRYSIDVPGSGAVLVFSFVGFVTQQISVGNQSVIDVALMQDVAQLEDVVVVGYGVQRKRDVTGSVASVKVSD
ncbi:MAG: carboxypeptidase-like regulatory domain-containing protein, partial [Rhodothermales bacterium]